MHGLRRMLLAVCAATLVLAAWSQAAAGRGTPVANQDLQPTPAMGFDSYDADGCNVSAALLESAARYLHSSGMEADGYRYVTIDDCWEAPHRTAAGRLAADPSRFPGGIAPVADYVHALGLKLGVYADAGTETCAGYPGSFGHEALDARTFAAWGVNYVTYDQCNIPFQDFPGQSHQQVDTALYTKMSKALRATGFPIVFSMSNGTDPAVHPWQWGARVSNLWRTTADIEDSFASTVANFSADAGLYRYAHPGAFNDPDWLEVGNGGQTTTQYESQFSLWAELAAPLIAGTDLTALTPIDRAIYENRAVIAVDQDPLGRQGHVVADASGLYVLTRELAGGQHAVVLFNATGQAQTIATTASATGALPAPAYRLQDLWSARVTRTAGAIRAFVPADGVVMLRVSSLPAGTEGSTPAPATDLAVQTPPGPFTPGQTVSATVTLTDSSSVALTGATATVRAPAGWAPALTTLPLGTVAARAAVSRSVTLTAPAAAAAPLSATPLTATARYGHSGSPQTAAAITAADPLTLLSPLTTPNTTADTTGLPATVGQLGSAFSIDAAGTGVAPAVTTSTGAVPASDAYAAAVDPRGAATVSTARVTVTGQAGSPESPVGQAGLIERPSLTIPGTPEGVVLDVTTAGQVQLQYNATGLSFVTSAIDAPRTVSLPVTLQLQRSGSIFTGAYSTNGGVTWTTVGQAPVAPLTAAGADDVGVFHSAGAGGGTTEADFSGFVLASAVP